ncbi:hypothetical protein L3Y34_017651 [Caenorhabditis briggsae]|uniref:One cut domain family member n=1 Tax=Caenorhabditis briggsae TaxID=6238 RepID=A0AAE9ITW2_CAEBR|nr:hypothetical protein L3Y34_017651 [Caenorhabditis briggsae]
MESSRTASSITNGTGKSRRRNTDYLQIDPSSTFINNSRGFNEELPENFLDTISPHPVTPSASSSSEDAPTIEEAPTTSAPSLASLAPMSLNTDQPGSSFSGGSLLSPSYEHIKNEPEFSGSTSGLLSPLGSRRRESHEFSSDFIKEEEDLDEGNPFIGGIRADSPQNDRSAELGSMLLNEDHRPMERTPSPHSSFGSDPTSMIQRQLIKSEEVRPSGYSKPTPPPYVKPRNGARLDFEKTPYQRNSRKQKKPLGLLNQSSPSVVTMASSNSIAASSSIPTPPTAIVQPPPRRVYSTQDSNDPLNAEIGDDIYIDTRDLCKRIAFELKNHSIPQAIFAERILCRSQGTLSDLLRNPKPWNKLKSGRETFRRMYNWVSQPLDTRLAILDMKTEEVGRASGMSPPTPAQNVRTHSSRRSTSDHDGQTSKRPRLVFTDIQKRTLQAIFKETQRPSREMQQTIAEHLRLDLSTVANFFMNARRRSRLGVGNDEPAPYQQVRSITPPPGADGNPLTNGDDHLPLLNSVMAHMYKGEASTCSADQQLVERGFGGPVGSQNHSTVGRMLQNGHSHNEEDIDLDELNDDELAYEEDVEIGEEEDEDDVRANGDTLPPPKEEHVAEKAVIKEEAPDDDEYGAAAKLT